MKPDGVQKWDLLGVEMGFAAHYPEKGWIVSNAIKKKSATKSIKNPNNNIEKLWRGVGVWGEKWNYSI